MIALAAIGILGTGALTLSQVYAQSTTNSTSTTQSTIAAAPNTAGTFDPSKGGHIGANGTKEELLTGDNATKATAAALAAYPGGTIQRVETDAEGATYEAHMTKSDGTQITVKFDSNFNVTGTETGPTGMRGQAQ